MIISLAVCLALLWVIRRAEEFHFSRDTTLDISLVLMVVGLIGARLFHVLYESPNYYSENILRVFEIWNGGFVFYGGAIPATLAGIFWAAKKNRGLFKGYLDLFAPVVSFTYILGRVACFFAGCCYGKQCDLPWAVNGRHPTQIYAVLGEIGILLLLIYCERIPPNKRRPAFLGKSGCIFYLWMVLHSFIRFFLEFLRDDNRGPKFLFSVSGWISLLVFILGIYFVVKNPQKLKS